MNLSRRLLLSAALAFLPVVVAAGPALVAIDDPAPGLTARLLAEEVTVVREGPHGLLALLDPGESAILDRMALRWRRVDADVTGRTYYVVGIPAPARLHDLANEVPILDVADHEAVVAADRATVERIAGRGLELEQVVLRPVVPPRPPTLRLRGDGGPAPLIQEMVGRVDVDRINAHVDTLQSLVTRLAYTPNAFEAAEYLENEFRSYGIEEVFTHNFDDSFAPNVIAVIRGQADPDVAVLVGGHFDSIASVGTMGAPGADDNASGTAAVLECARALAGYQFERSVMFVGFGAEELGLVGSAALAFDLPGLGFEVEAMLNVDMCGYLEPGDILDLDIISNASSEWLREVVLDAGATYSPSVPTVASPPPGIGTSDHASFWARGYSAIFFFEDSDHPSRYIHTDQDLIGISYNSPTLAAHTTRVAVASMATLAGPLGLSVFHTPLAATAVPDEPYPIEARVVSPEPLELDSLWVYYAVEAGPARGGDVERIALVSTLEDDVFSAHIPPQPLGSFVRYYLSAEDVFDRQVTDPLDAPASWHRFYVGSATPVFTDDMEEDRGWTVRAPGDDATSGLWERADPVGTVAEDLVVQPENDHTPDPGVMAYVTGNGIPGGPAGASDVDGGGTTLTSPVLDLAGFDAAGVVYHRWYVNGDGDDTWQVDVNDGSGWVPLERLTTTDRTWRRVERLLSDVIDLTETVQIRFVAEDRGEPSLVEAGIDDVVVTGYLDEVTPIDPEEGPWGPMVPGRLAQRVRNPYAASGTVELVVPEPGRTTTLSVVDVAGREVARLIDGEIVSGYRRLDWDGRDPAGRPVPSGLYLVHVQAGLERRTSKLIVVR
jgi:hypothetical protein